MCIHVYIYMIICFPSGLAGQPRGGRTSIHYSLIVYDVKFSHIISYHIIVDYPIIIKS